MDDVRRHLQKAAEAHQPDRDAMWARVQRGMTDSTDAKRARSYRRRRQASWLKVTLAGVAGVGVLGLGGLAVAAGVQQRAPEHPAPVTDSPTSHAPTVAPTPPSPATKPAAPAPTSGPSTPRHAPTPAPAADGPIVARGEVDSHSTVYWEQNTLIIDVAQPLSSFTVELRVAQTPGVQNTGTWLTGPPDDYTVTVTPADGFLVYRWTLKPGRTVPAAQQRFGAQFNHGTGKRDASKDTFLVEATAAGHTAAVHGGFTAAG